MKSTSSAGGQELNYHTCTLVHRDVTDDLDATLPLCHPHNSTPFVDVRLDGMRGC
jgi:hypothetical protein